MEKITGQLTVFFDDPFWVGVFERIEENKLSVCRVVFGAEPKDYEVYDFILKNMDGIQEIAASIVAPYMKIFIVSFTL